MFFIPTKQHREQLMSYRYTLILALLLHTVTKSVQTLATVIYQFVKPFTG
jgi:hypothetical protein